MNTNDLYIVNYCHPNCVPLKNIMRLPKDEAFALARELAGQNRDTTAFYRFADFENYYPKRLKTDELLYERFVSLGGKPIERHPLSFVLEGSEFLDEWFGRGIVTRIPLNEIPAERVSFTYGDSMSVQDRDGDFTIITKDMLLKAISEYGGTIEKFMAHINERYRYIEVQVWDDIEDGRYDCGNWL